MDVDKRGRPTKLAVGMKVPIPFYGLEFLQRWVCMRRSACALHAAVEQMAQTSASDGKKSAGHVPYNCFLCAEHPGCALSTPGAEHWARWVCLAHWPCLARVQLAGDHDRPSWR